MKFSSLPIKTIRIFGIVSFLFLCTRAIAKDDVEVAEAPKLVALQKRFYPFINHGLTFQAGFLPLDAFNKSVVVGASYSYYLSEFTTWEVANFNYAFNVATDLKRELELLNLGISGANKPYLDYVNYYLTTNILYTPFYTKNLLFNRSLLHGETSFLAGAGAAKFEFAGFHPLVSAGMIIKFFMGQRTSLKFDFRENVYFDSSGINGLLSLIIGLEYKFGEGPDTPKVVEKVDEVL